MDNFEIFGLQKEPGGIDWLNGRNRIDLQIENFSDYKFYLRIKVRISSVCPRFFGTATFMTSLTLELRFKYAAFIYYSY